MHKRLSIRVHGSVLLTCALGSGLKFAPGAWLGGVVVLLIHSLGHWVLGKAFGFEVKAWVIDGMGGGLRFQGPLPLFKRSLIAIGGPLAQGVLFLFAWLFKLPFLGMLRANAPEAEAFFVDFLNALIYLNAFLMAIHFLPLASSDGVHFFRLFASFFHRKRRSLYEVNSLPEKDLASFVHPEEIQKRHVSVLDEGWIQASVRRVLNEAKRKAMASDSSLGPNQTPSG
ncbi:MAG: hypothetical protein NZM37_08060 [Sandaracinaceae bacterium]|nr:hypothetical protein [Sandaracinaceae bacterium]